MVCLLHRAHFWPTINENNILVFKDFLAQAGGLLQQEQMVNLFGRLLPIIPLSTTLLYATSHPKSCQYQSIYIKAWYPQLLHLHWKTTKEVNSSSHYQLLRWQACRVRTCG
jgi:hypothetical protein